MFDKIYKALYLRIFVNIIVKHQKTIVYIELFNSKGVVDSFQKGFDEDSEEHMYDYIASYTKESPFHYISILDTSSEQGVLPTCSKDEMPKFHDMSRALSRCYNDEWAYYTSKSDLHSLEKQYSKIGLDLVFSPFIILHNFFKDKIPTHKAMYVLIEENYMSLSIYNNSELLFGQHLDVENYSQNDELLMDDQEEEHNILEEDDDTIDLDDIDTLDDLDDFGDIEDLDTLEEMEDFTQTRDIEEEFNQEQKATKKKSEGFNEDYQRFLLIQKAIHHFYKDDRFKSEFVEAIYIADSINVSRDLKKYLEEEMFLSVYIRHIDLVYEVCELAKTELE